MMIKNINAVGIYGNASLNGIELAVLNTDGVDVHDYGLTAAIPYPEDLFGQIRTLINQRIISFHELENNPQVQKLRDKISDFYAETVTSFCNIEDIDVIGIDGLTVCHEPENRCSYQLENGHKVSSRIARPIVTHFHKADLLAGGQAAPLSTSFYAMIAQNINKPALFIDVEAVTTLIYLGESGEVMAFDAAPGLALIEDWTFRHANMQTDYNGRLAATGQIHQQIITPLLKHKILHKQPPKSMDIHDFCDKKEHLEGLSLEDGAATANCFIAEAIYQAALDFLPKIPSHIFISGRGTQNPSLLRQIKQNFAPREPQNITTINPKLTCIGAQSTAFNAVRRLHGLPLTFPNTTGAYEPLTGGEIYENTK